MRRESSYDYILIKCQKRAKNWKQPRYLSIGEWENVVFIKWNTTQQ